MDAHLVLLVDGALLVDTDNVIGGIRERLVTFQEQAAAMQQALGALMSELSTALDGFQTSLTTLVTEIEDLLTQPSPDVVAAVQRLGEMKTLVDTEVAHIQAAEQPPAPTP